MGSSTKSGTPLETRQGTESAGNVFESLFGAAGRGGQSPAFENLMQLISGPAQRLGRESVSRTLGFDPAALGLEGAVGASIRDPGATGGLFRGIDQSEARATERGAAGLRESLGAQGGRFSTGLLGAEAGFRRDIAGEFSEKRGELLLGAQANQNQAISNLFNVISSLSGQGQNATTALLGQALQFLAPGEAIFDPGLGRDLLGAGVSALPLIPFRGGGGGGGGGG